MAGFKDHFSGHSGAYQRFRPTYPSALFSWLADEAPDLSLALDVATGNGQAAVGLAKHFDRVIATDASAQQIAQASRNKRVEYEVAPAERQPVATESVSVLTVAQALHWFDLPAFWQECRRVLQPGGVLAVWTYRLSQVDASVDAVVARLFGETFAGHWPPERSMVDAGYEGIALPFPELEVPALEMEAKWTLAQFEGYLRTWSAARRYEQAEGRDAIAEAHEALAEAWGDPAEVRRVAWPLVLRAARSPG